jgi:predicted RND superfamily exporter protein
MLRGVGFNYDARALLLRDRPSIILQEQIRERYKIAAAPVGILTPTLEEARAVYDALRDPDSDRFGIMKPDKYSTADVVVSLFMFVPPMEQQRANAKILAQMKKDFEPIKPSMLEPRWRKYYKTAMKVLDAKPFTLEQLPERYRAQFVNQPDSRVKGFVTFIYPKIAMYDSRDLVAFSDQVGQVQAGGKTYYATGTPILFAHLAQIVLHDGKFFTLLAGGLILIIIFLALRGVVATLVALLPLAMGMTWMMGLMALLGQQVNFMNVVVFPVVLGYGMGSGIYILHRFRESGSAWVALTSTGRAVLASCVTTLVGWGSLLTANHLGLESMGMLAALGIGCVLVTSVIFLPAVLRLLTNWFHIKWGQQKSSAKASAPRHESAL